MLSSDSVSGCIDLLLIQNRRSQKSKRKKERTQMNKFATIAGLAIAATAMTASADVLLNVDLSVVDQVTFTATAGLSSADASGTDNIGVLLEDFFSAPTAAGIFISGTGDLAAAGNSSDATPGLFNGSGNTGLNFWSWTVDTSTDFVTGAVAFTGSATWDVSAAQYADMLAGNTSGNIGAFADTDDDISVVIGQWNVVPAPGAFALLGLGGIAACRRNRA
tara:strand:- start:47691 stop:48350 length:660 start_codon:yes stop_codon:yes gene_type:complete